MNLLFESFMVFYLIEILMLIYFIIYFYYKPEKQEKKIWDPLGLKQIEEEQNVRKKSRRTSR